MTQLPETSRSGCSQTSEHLQQNFCCRATHMCDYLYLVRIGPAKQRVQQRLDRGLLKGSQSGRVQKRKASHAGRHRAGQVPALRTAARARPHGPCTVIMQHYVRRRGPFRPRATRSSDSLDRVCADAVCCPEVLRPRLCACGI